jgi:hypothetical protein
MSDPARTSPQATLSIPILLQTLVRNRAYMRDWHLTSARPAFPRAENSRGGGSALAVLLPPWKQLVWRRSAMGCSPSPSPC